MSEEAERTLICSVEPSKVQDYLYNSNIISFVVIVLAIITSEFWFEFFHQILREITNQERPRWYYMLTAAIFWTFVFIIITILIFKIPVAASYTL